MTTDTTIYTPIYKTFCKDIDRGSIKELFVGQDVVIRNVEIISDENSPLYGRAVYFLTAKYGEGTFHILAEDFDRIFRKKVLSRDIG